MCNFLGFCVCIHDNIMMSLWSEGDEWFYVQDKANTFILFRGPHFNDVAFVNIIIIIRMYIIILL